jgi:hypothetical protein
MDFLAFPLCGATAPVPFRAPTLKGILRSLKRLLEQHVDWKMLL